MKKSLKLCFSTCFLFFTIFITGQTYEIRVGSNVSNSCHTLDQLLTTNQQISIKVINLSGSTISLTIGTQTEEIPLTGKNITYDYQGVPLHISVKFPTNTEYNEINTSCQESNPTRSNSTPPSNSKPSDFIFIPSREEEKAILAAFTNSKSSKAIKNKKDIYLLYDVKNNDLSYRERNRNIFKMRPKIDQNIYIKINNYKPYQDSILVKYNFYDRNLEYGDRIISFLNGQINLTKEEGEKTDTTKKDNNGATATSRQKISSEIIQSFKEEMMRFYLSKKEEITNDKINVLEEYIYHIQRKIKENFAIESAAPEDVLNLVSKKIDDDNTLPNKEDLKTTLRAGVDYYKRILEYNVLSYPPIQVKNFDVTELKFEIYRNQKLVNNQDNSYNYLNKGGFKIDFSLGLMGHWLSNHIYSTVSVQQMDTVYRVVDSMRTNEIEKVNATMKSKIIRDDGGDFAINIGVLSHFYFRTGRRVNASLSTGISLGENSKVRYLVGGSALFGSEQRLIITGGCAIGQVKRLKSIFTEGQLLEATTTPPALDKEVWKGAWFVGLSFNFGSVSTGGKK
jgi:hypothetical protein